MKDMRIQLLFVIFGFTTLISPLSAQNSESYFYGYRTRYDLVADSMQAVVLSHDKVEIVTNDFQKNNLISESILIHNRSAALIKLRSKSPFKSKNSHYDILPVFKHGSFSLVPTGEIVFQLKSNVSFNEILSYCQGQIIFVKETCYGTITVKPIVMSDLLKMANKIYESGMVEWAEPDFFIEIIKHQTVTPTDQFYPQ